MTLKQTIVTTTKLLGSGNMVLVDFDLGLDVHFNGVTEIL